MKRIFHCTKQDSNPRHRTWNINVTSPVIHKHNKINLLKRKAVSETNILQPHCQQSWILAWGESGGSYLPKPEAPSFVARQPEITSSVSATQLGKASVTSARVLAAREMPREAETAGLRELLFRDDLRWEVRANRHFRFDSSCYKTLILKYFRYFLKILNHYGRGLLTYPLSYINSSGVRWSTAGLR